MRARGSDLRRKIGALGEQERYTHFSYIPYREGLNTPENQKKGYEYLSDTMKKTYEHAIGNTSLWKMRSNVQGMTIAEELPWQFPLILNLVERMDFEVYFDRAGKVLKPKKELDPLMENQLGRSLTTFWANTSNAFNWQKSRVWAQGVGQIMPSTYFRYWKNDKYGDLFPESDFDIATRDHETSFRLQISHFDDQVYQLPWIVKKNWKTLMHDKESAIGILAILAAGYNGSMKRIVDEVFADMPEKDMSSLTAYRERLNPRKIMESMEKALKRRIEASSQPTYHIDKKTKKKTLLPLNAEQKEEIARHTAMYKESMTYVLKAEYVWKSLKDKYKSKF